MGKSYIPTKEADFVDWSANLIAVSKAHAADRNLSESQVADLETLHGEFKALHIPIYDRKPTPHPEPSTSLPAGKAARP
jgi:hypothetical protein